MDHYSTLGVPKGAAADEIKKAYRKLASTHHPDKGGDTATFQKIQAAYETLSDPQKRQEFDNPAPQQRGFPGGFNFGAGADPFGTGMHDFMQEIFRQQTQQQQPRHQTFRTTIWVTLEQVHQGGDQQLKLQTSTGTHMITVKIPKGIPDGGQVRIDNVLDGAALLVEFRTHKHLRFDRHGNDLTCTHQISVLDLIVGTSFEFVTLSGMTLAVTIPPKTQPFHQMKISGHGLPILGSNAHGDQILVLKAFVPAEISPEIIAAISAERAPK